MSERFASEVDQLIRARYSLLYLVTFEETRARSILVRIASHRKKALFEWSMTDGLRCAHSADEKDTHSTKRLREPMAVLNEILQSSESAIYVLKDFHEYMEAPEVVRQLRDLAEALRRTKKSIVILTPVLKMPQELEKAVTILDMPLPTEEELDALLRNRIVGSGPRRFRVDLTETEYHSLVKAAKGLTLVEAENAFARAIVDDGALDRRDIRAILEEKKQVIRKSGVLDYYDADENIAAVGGMDLLKDWLRKRVRAFTDDARRYGLPEPRGILLMGIQGCGKSLVAKTIASSWRLPLLRMDMSLIFQSYIGSSEQNMRKALKVAESLAPIVLWVDEIEKAFSGVGGSGNSDSGTTSRVVGTFLTWLQEKSTPVFVVATANEVRDLPPELLRKGRLDEIFFVDLPRREERMEIFRIHLARLKRDPDKFDLRTLAQAAEGFSGAEIEQAIISALHDSFFAERDLLTDDVVQSLRETVPLSQTMREKIDALRTWARDRARPVSSIQNKVEA